MVGRLKSQHNARMLTGVAESTSPNWQDVAEEVHCPLCEYNLRGLVEPRCPECGFRFIWSELLDPAQRSHPYLFEHHPQRNLWSLWRTLAGGFLPGKFWRSVKPGHPSRPRRVVFYAILTGLPLFITALAYSVGALSSTLSYWRWALSRRIVNGQPVPLPLNSGMVWNVLRRFARGDALMHCGVAWLIWPGLTLAALLVFQWSMRRARIKLVHVVRCTVYSADMRMLLAVVYAAVAVDYWRLNQFSGGWWSYGWLGLAAAFAPLPLFIYRLVMAYRHYLRFDHALATVLASQAMVGLLVWKLLLVIQGY